MRPATCRTSAGSTSMAAAVGTTSAACSRHAQRRVRVVGARAAAPRRALRRLVLGREARGASSVRVCVRVGGHGLARRRVLGVLQARRKRFVLREGVDGSCFYCVLLLGLGRDEAPAGSARGRSSLLPSSSGVTCV